MTTAATTHIRSITKLRSDQHLAQRLAIPPLSLATARAATRHQFAPHLKETL